MADELRMKIQELEILRLENYTIIQKKITNALRAGRRLDPRVFGSTGMKQRYLTALVAYGRLGLTPAELFESHRRTVWLMHPCDKGSSPKSVKTVAMFLLRLKRDGLARREEEENTFRYYITDSGRRRLRYYTSLDRRH